MFFSSQIISALYSLRLNSRAFPSRGLSLCWSILLSLSFSVSSVQADSGDAYGPLYMLDEGYTSTDWSYIRQFPLGAGEKAHIDALMYRFAETNGYDAVQGDDIIWKWYDSENTLVDTDKVSYTGVCWYNALEVPCVEGVPAIGLFKTITNKTGIWRVETYFNDILRSDTSFDVIGRELHPYSGDSFSVYENEILEQPLAAFLRNYDGTGTVDKEVQFEIIQRPKGKASGGLNILPSSQPTGTKSNIVSVRTNTQGIANAWFEAGTKPGIYIIQATTYSAPDHPATFTVEVLEGPVPPDQQDPLEAALDPERNLGKPEQCQALTGNPVNVITGNKFESILLSEGRTFVPVPFRLYYNSMDFTGSALGPKWRYSYSRSVVMGSKEINGRSKSVAMLVRDDGNVIHFYKSGKSWVPVYGDVRTTLTSSNSGWDYHTEDDSAEHYDSGGKLLSITRADGNGITIAYDASGRISQAVSTTGDFVTFSHSSTHLGSVGFGGRTDSREEIRFTFNASGMLSYQFPAGAKRYRYHYEDSRDPTLLTGKSLLVGDSVNYTTTRLSTYVYDTKGRVTSTSLADDVDRKDIVYGDDGSRKVTDSQRNSTYYNALGRQGVGLLSSIDGPCGCGSNDQAMTFDDNNNLLTLTSFGVVTEYGNYDSRGNPGYIIEAKGTTEERRTDYTYDPRFFSRISKTEETSVRSGQVRTTTTVYDDQAHVTERTVSGFTPEGTPVSRTTRYEYNGVAGQISLTDGPREDISDLYQFDYYADNAATGVRTLLKSVTGPDGTRLRDNIQYEALKPVSETLPNGEVITQTYQEDIFDINSDDWNYNQLLESLTVTDAQGNSRTTYWTYTVRDQVETITTGYGTPDAKTLTFTYDTAMRLMGVTDALGNAAQYTLDTRGNVLEEKVFDSTGQLSTLITRVYDAYSHLTQESAANEQTGFSFAADGTLQSTTDGNSVLNVYSYDSLKRLTGVTQNSGGTGPTADTAMSYGYDAQDRLVRVTDANGNATGYVFDDLSNLLGQSSPDTGNQVYSHDAAGNRTSMTDAKGQTFSYTYDAFNRLTFRDASGTDHDVTYLWDTCPGGYGRLCSVSSADATVQYSYTGFGELETLTQQTGATALQIDYRYNSAGEVSHVFYPGGAEVRYIHNAAGDISAVSLVQNGVTTPLISGGLYGYRGQLQEITYGNGLHRTLSYDAAGRLETISDPGYSRAFGYDSAGNLLTAGPESFTYDALNRLSTSDAAGPVQSFEYDANGNRTLLSDGGAVTAYAVDPLSNQYSSISGASVSYDDNGNLQSRDGNVLVHGPDNRLEAVSGISGYEYNGLGQRVSKSVTGAGMTMFLYDDAGRLLVEADENGSPVAEHVYMGSVPVAVIRYDSGQPQVFYVHTDQLGTPRSLTDAGGTVVWQWLSSAFGETAANSDADGNGVEVEYNLRFAGQYFDAETGLHYNYFRDYDPLSGRYVQSDPIGILRDYSDPQLQIAVEMGLIVPHELYDSLNHLYGYADQNPINFIDPSGLDSLRAALMQAIARGNTRQIRNIMDALSDPKLRKAAQDALDKFGSKADDWIGKNCKGSINREFPENLRDKTLEEIRRGNSAEYKKAWKLLNDKRFQK